MLKHLFLAISLCAAGHTAAAEWQHTNPGFDRTGQVTLKTLSGVTSQLSNTGQQGLQSSASPTVLNVVNNGRTPLFALKIAGQWYYWLEGVGLAATSLTTIQRQQPQWTKTDVLSASPTETVTHGCSVKDYDPPTCVANPTINNPNYVYISTSAILPTACNYPCTGAYGRTADVLGYRLGSALVQITLDHQFNYNANSCDASGNYCNYTRKQRVGLLSDDVEIYSAVRMLNESGRRGTNLDATNRFQISTATYTVKGRKVAFLNGYPQYYFPEGGYSPDYSPILNAVVVESNDGTYVASALAPVASPGSLDIIPPPPPPPLEWRGLQPCLSLA